MAYIRKTRDEYQLWVAYPGPHGWEHEVSEDTAKAAREQAKTYRLNCPQYPVKIVHKRIRKDEA